MIDFFVVFGIKDISGWSNRVIFPNLGQLSHEWIEIDILLRAYLFGLLFD